eukprot:GHVR01077885.1.p1 GENE.GHVR01077885.1~~GHVR01077885.1.p1  ORF type:complete len:869 (+),score=202.54 GHVR01077885.1:49-2655(+)
MTSNCPPLQIVTEHAIKNVKPTFKSKLAQCWEKYGKKTIDELMTELEPWNHTDINAEIAADAARKIAKNYRVNNAIEFENEIRNCFLLAEERGLAFESTLDLIIAIYDRLFTTVDLSVSNNGFDVTLFILVVSELVEDPKAPQPTAEDVQHILVLMGFIFEPLPPELNDTRGSCLSISLDVTQFASLLCTFVSGLSLEERVERTVKPASERTKKTLAALDAANTHRQTKPDTHTVNTHIDEIMSPQQTQQITPLGEPLDKILGEMPPPDSLDATDLSDGPDALELWATLQKSMCRLAPVHGKIDGEGLSTHAHAIRVLVVRYGRELKLKYNDEIESLNQNIKRKEISNSELHERLEKKEIQFEKQLMNEHKLIQENKASLQDTVTKLQQTRVQLSSMEGIMDEQKQRLDQAQQTISEKDSTMHDLRNQLEKAPKETDAKGPKSGTLVEEQASEIRLLKTEVRKLRAQLNDAKGGGGGDSAGGVPKSTAPQFNSTFDLDKNSNGKKTYEKMGTVDGEGMTDIFSRVDLMIEQTKHLLDGGSDPLKGSHFKTLAYQLDVAVDDDSDKECDDNAKHDDDDMIDRVNRSEQILLELQSGFALKELEEADTCTKEDEEKAAMKAELERVKQDRDSWKVKAVTSDSPTRVPPPVRPVSIAVDSRLEINDREEKLAAQRRVTEMQAGAWMFKLGPNFRSRLKVVRNFQRNKVRMWLSDDFRFLYWAQDKPENKRNVDGYVEFCPKVAKFIPLEAVARFEYGENSRAFRMQEGRADRNPPFVCFSIYTVGRSLDLVAHEQKIESWILGLNNLIPYNPGRTFYSPKEFRMKKLLLKIEYGLDVSPGGLAQKSKGKVSPSIMQLRLATKDMLMTVKRN